MTDSLEKGKRAERAMVRWLHDNGYPQAIRTKAGQHRDPVDIWPLGPVSPPAVVISLKSGYAKDVHPGTMLWQQWWSGLIQSTLALNPEALPLLCHHREGKANPAQWRWWVDVGWVYNDLNLLGPVQVTGTQAIALIGKWPK